MKSFHYDEIIYYDIDEYTVSVGAPEQIDEEIKATAVDNADLISGKVTIPETVNDKKVTEVGVFAFYRCVYVTEFDIQARITIIKTNGFDQCKGLLKINIPNTVTTLEVNAITCTEPSTTDKTSGNIHIFFEPHSQIASLAVASFGYRDNIYVYMCEPLQPDFEQNAFLKYTSVTIYSNDISSTTFANHPITHLSLNYCSPHYNILTNIIYCKEMFSSIKVFTFVFIIN